MVLTYGLVYLPTDAAESQPTPVALRDVTVDAHMVETCVEVVVSQTYQNAESLPIQAEYIFPLDERAAVCEFVAEVDGRVVVGEIHEKEQAQEIYDNAIARGDGAYLLTQEKEDVFRAKIGNVMPGSTVVIKITYVAELKTEEDAVRFILPTTVMPRYSPANSSEPVVNVKVDTVAASTSYGLNLNLKCTMLNKVVSVTSPTHAALLSATLQGREASASFTQRSVMDKDLVVLVKTEQPLVIQACLETDKANHSHAAMLTLCPHFEFAERKTECIFIVDRSGSMGGDQIIQARAALVLFLRSLPSDCYINIIGFGSEMQKVWPESVKYDQQSLLKATQHAQSMDADLGGTEILEPLKAAISAPANKGYSREIFILTDGQVDNTDAVCKYIRDHREKARVFSMGIGDAVSRALVEGMARAGNGTAKFVSQGARMEPAVIAQLRQATQPALTEVTVDWGVHAKTTATTATVDSASEHHASALDKIKGMLGFHGSAHAVSGVHNLPIKQAPCDLPPIFSDERFQCYLLLEEGQPLPKHIKISAVTPDGPLHAEAEITEETTFEGNLIHRMAARSLLRDLDDGTSALHEEQKKADHSPFRHWWYNPDQAAIKAESVKLSKRYQVVSKHTSFVAVEQRSAGERVQCGWTVNRVVPTAAPVSQIQLFSAPVMLCAPSGGGGRHAGAMSKSKKMAAPRMMMMSASRSGPPPPPAASDAMAVACCPAPPPPAVGGLQQCSDECVEREEKKCAASREMEMDCADDAGVKMDIDEEEAAGGGLMELSSEGGPAAHRGDPMTQIVLLQSFEGYFTLDAELAGICGVSVDAVLDLVKQAVTGKDDTTLRNIAGSILAVAFFEKRLADKADEWSLVAGKARRWVTSNAGGASVVQNLLGQVSALL